MTTNESYHTTYDADAGTTGDATDCYVDLDDVTARKSKTLTDDDILQVEFVVNSTRSEPVRLEIRDALPHGFPLDRVGFCPDYGQENWSVGDGNELVYESELEPRGDKRTVYAVKPNEQFDPSLFSIGSKIITKVDGDRAPTDAGADPHTDARMEINPVSDGGSEAIEAGADDEAESSDLADSNGVATTDPSAKEQSTSPESMRAEQSAEEPSMDEPLTDGDDEVASAVDSGGMSVTTDTETTEDEPRPFSSGTHEARDATPDEGVLARLTTELEEKHVSDEELAALEEHLTRLTTDRHDGRTSLEARLQRAERELNELSAYTDALSEFLDERGAGQELLDEMEAQAAEVQSQLADVSDEMSALDERLETVEAREERLDAFDDRLDEITGRLDDLDDRQETTTDRLDEITGRLDDLDDRQETTTDRLDDLDDRQETTTDRLETATDRLDSVDEHVGRLDDELDVLRTHHEEAAERIARTRESVDTLDDRLDTAETERAARNEALSEGIDSVAEEVEEIRRWHRDFGRLLDDFAAFGREPTGDERGETPEAATGVQRLRTATNDSAPSETDATTAGDEAPEANEEAPTDGSSQRTDAIDSAE